MAQDIAHNPAAALPATREQLLAQRKIKRSSSLTDLVDVIFVEMWPEHRFRACNEAVWNEHTVEGSLVDDEVLAAQMIRDYAKKKSMDSVAEAKTADIRRALKVAKRRNGVDRKTRLNGSVAT